MIRKKAAILHGLGSEHTYEFLDGAEPSVMAPGMSESGVLEFFQIQSSAQERTKHPLISEG